MLKGKFGWLMSLCCILPLLAVMYFIHQGDTSSSPFFWILILLCPLMHLFMHRNMKHGNENDETKEN